MLAGLQSSAGANVTRVLSFVQWCTNIDTFMVSFLMIFKKYLAELRWSAAYDVIGYRGRQ